jgi:hypothetical protein
VEVDVVGESSFESRIPEEFLGVLFELGREFGFDPLASVELEDYFANLLASFTGRVEDLNEWLRQQVTESFRCATCRPGWIQGSNWQVYRARPMLFVGQVAVPPISGVFHDEGAFYVFFDPETGESRTIVQIA